MEGCETVDGYNVGPIVGMVAHGGCGSFSGEEEVETGYRDVGRVLVLFDGMGCGIEDLSG